MVMTPMIRTSSVSFIEPSAPANPLDANHPAAHLITATARLLAAGRPIRRPQLLGICHRLMSSQRHHRSFHPAIPINDNTNHRYRDAALFRLDWLQLIPPTDTVKWPSFCVVKLPLAAMSSAHQPPVSGPVLTCLIGFVETLLAARV